MFKLSPEFVQGVTHGANFALGFLGVVTSVATVSYIGSEWLQSYWSKSSKTREIPMKVFKQTNDSITFTDEFKALMTQVSVKVQVDKKNKIESITTDCRDWKLPSPTLTSQDIERN